VEGGVKYLEAVVLAIALIGPVAGMWIDTEHRRKTALRIMEYEMERAMRESLRRALAIINAHENGDA
jgi:hypothetical protein